MSFRNAEKSVGPLSLVPGRWEWLRWRRRTLPPPAVDPPLLADPSRNANAGCEFESSMSCSGSFIRSSAANPAPLVLALVLVLVLMLVLVLVLVLKFKLELPAA